MAKRKIELPLYTARVVVQVDPDKRFWTHEESIAKKHHECCVQWSSRKRTWTPRKDCCPVGTHDYFVGDGWVVYANTAQPWKKTRKKIDKKRRPDIKIHLVANGEIARQLYASDPLDNFLIEGHITSHYNIGRFWQELNVFNVKAVSDEQIKSQLSVVAFDRFREKIREISTPLPNIPPEKVYASAIKSRRLAVARGEARETLSATEEDDQ